MSVYVYIYIYICICIGEVARLVVSFGGEVLGSMITRGSGTVCFWFRRFRAWAFVRKLVRVQ